VPFSFLGSRGWILTSEYRAGCETVFWLVIRIDSQQTVVQNSYSSYVGGDR